MIIAFVSGFMKGLFSEIASLAAIIAGIYVAIHFSFYTEDFLRENFLKWSEQTYAIVAYVVSFLGTVLVIVFAGKILTKMADITALGLINKFLGGLFSTLKIAIIFSIIFVFLDKQAIKIPFLSEEVFKTSVLHKPIKSIVPMFFPYFSSEDKTQKKTIDFPKISI